MTAPTDVVAAWRYPLKSARGEPLTTAFLDREGVRGDRTWACLDAGDGTVGSAKHPARWGRLLGVRARWCGDDVVLDVDGAEVTAGTPEAEAALAGRLGRAVRLTRTVPADARLHRLLPIEAGMVPDWMRAGPGEVLVTVVAGARPGGRFVDFGAVHVVTTGALARLSEQTGSAVAAARFRPNLVVDAAGDAAPGDEIRVGDALLRVVLPAPRCVVPGLEHGSLPADRRVLAALAKHHRVEVAGRGRAACFGFYADVVEPGVARVG